MELSEFTLRVFMLFVPGLVSFLIIGKLTVHGDFKLYHVILYSLLLGLVSYFLYYSLTLIPGIGLSFTFVERLADKTQVIEYREVILVSLMSVPVGTAFTFLINYKVLPKAARYLKIARTHGDVGVWSHIMDWEHTDWVVVRDDKNDIMYEGWVEVYSDVGEEDEMFLRDVIVYRNSTAERLYDTPAMYLARRREELTVEFPKFEFTDLRKRNS